MRAIFLAIAALAMLACSAGASFIIKDPIVEKCTKAGIQGCPDLTEGVLLFVEGKQDEGKDKVLQGAAANSPEQLKQFAAILQMVGKIPGAEEYMRPVLEVTKIILAEPKSQSSARNAKVPQPDAVANSEPSRDENKADHSGKRSEPPVVLHVPSGPRRAMTADTDAEQIANGFTAPALNPSHVACESPFGLGTAWCLAVMKGPFVVTDLRAGPGCQADVFAAAGDAGSRAWALAGAPASPLIVQGGRIMVRQGDSLVIGTGGKGASELRCAVTWAGFRPYKPQELRDVFPE